MLFKDERKNPLVLIVGAGVARLFLAILLERAGIPYQIYERAKGVTLGAVMSLNARVFPVIEQLGLYKELLKVSLRSRGGFKINKSDLSLIYNLKTDIQHGDIVIGADGAYSGVRQAMYKTLAAEGKLPSSDAVALNKGFICMVGTTKSLDPARYPNIDNTIASCNQIIGDNNKYCRSAFTAPGNSICWNVILQPATVEESASHKFKNAEWGGDSDDSMIKETRDFLIPFGNNTLGDVTDATPEDNISKNYGRTVLIGDACHKLLPSAGLGAVTSIQDAVVLANSLYEIKGSFMEKILRTVVFNWLPESVKLKGSIKGLDSRSQASFLPQVPTRGVAPVLPQKVSQQYLDEQAKLNAQEDVDIKK
ncbi:hypothetical protein BGZ47_004105 [Haplosporangium gracile]|nr:hypothetical protein BGZ47_004105 [Haplosporangium gracile]